MQDDEAEGVRYEDWATKNTGSAITSAVMPRLSRDWWAVLAAAVAVMLIKLRLLGHIPW